MQTFSAGDIAKRIVRPTEALPAAIDRVRNWTDMGILQPVGEENPGRGKARKYSWAAVERAISVQAIIDGTGMPAVAAAAIVKSRQWEAQRLISEVTGGASGRHVLLWRDYDSTEIHALAWITKAKALQHIESSEAQVHILLDLSKYLHNLKGAD